MARPLLSRKQSRNGMPMTARAPWQLPRRRNLRSSFMCGSYILLCRDLGRGRFRNGGGKELRAGGQALEQGLHLEAGILEGLVGGLEGGGFDLFAVLAPA